MPHTASAAKRLRKSEKRRRQNRVAAKKLKGVRKDALAAVAKGEPGETDTTFKAVQSTLDRAATKGYIHPNKAARLKSRLAKKVKAATAKS